MAERMPRSEQSRAHGPTPDAPHRGGAATPAPAAEEYLDAVYRYARRRLPTPEAEDVTQACFEALYRAIAAGRTPDDAGAYLLGVARRRVADSFRRRHRRPPPVSLPPDWDQYGETALPAEVLADAELRALVQTALGFLRPDEAALLEARYRAGASTAELAERHATTPKAIENRLRRARAAFLACFRRIGGDWTDDRPEGEGPKA